jgi:xanthine dehydrogenase YagS FAD-binding subunit
MRPFTYHRPATSDDAIAAIGAEKEARFLAGGTNLIDLMKMGVEHRGASGWLADRRHGPQ